MSPKNIPEIPGITTPEVFIGTHGTVTPIHKEDQDVCSLTYMMDCVGEGKLW